MLLILLESWIESKVGEKGEWSKSACEMTKRMKKGRKKRPLRRMRRRTQSPKKRSSFMMPVSPCTKSKSKSKSKHGKAKEEKRRLRHYYAPPPPPPLLHNRQAASAAPHIAALLPNTRSPFREFLVHNISGYSFLQNTIIDEYAKTIGKWEGWLFFYLGVIYILKNYSTEQNPLTMAPKNL